MPRSTACTIRVAIFRLAAYKNGRSSAIDNTNPRRSAREINVWLFQQKNAIGRTVVNSSRLPSTRQYTGVRGRTTPPLTWAWDKHFS